MEVTEVVSVPSKKVDVFSSLPLYSFQLNTNGDRCVPAGLDISKLVLVDVPDNLVKVHVWAGGSHLMSFDRKDFCEGKNVFQEGFPVSACWAFYIDLKFEYDGDYVLTNEVTEMVDEYEEVVEHSNTEEEFYDTLGDRYYLGCRVHRKKVPTGRQVPKVLKGATVYVPQLDFEVKKSDTYSGEQVLMHIWETIKIDPARDDEPYLRRLTEKYKLHMEDGSCVFERLKLGKPFEAKIENIIRIKDGMVAKVFLFS